MRPVRERGRRFGRRMLRAEFTRRRLHRITPEALASGEVEARLERRARRGPPPRPKVYVDLLRYLIDQGWTSSTRQARHWLEGGKVNVNGSVYAYRHFPKHELDHDKRGLPRIMVEGERDPRELR